jgi:hypothetical protein
MAGGRLVVDSRRPRNEGELIHQRPESHTHGAFPRRLLFPGERVLYEGRPELAASKGGRLVALAFLLALTLITGAAALAVNNGSEGASGILLTTAFFALLFGGLLALVVISWRHSAFALTHRRVVVVGGFWGSQFHSAEFAQVQRLSATADAVGPILFEISTSATAEAAPARPSTTLRWDSVRGAPATYAFIQTAFALARAEDFSELRGRRRRAALGEGRVACAYCGNPVRLEAIAIEAARCPRCTAPLSAASPIPQPERPAVLVLDAGPVLRPVLHLGRNVVNWYRATAVPVVLLAAFVALVESVSLGAIPGAADSAVLAAVAFSLPVLVILAYLLAGQVLRRWGTTLRTLRSNFTSNPGPWGAVTRRLRRRFAVAVSGYALSIMLLLAAVVTFPAALAQASTTQTVPPNLALLFGGEFGGFVASIVASQLALITSFPAIASGSGDAVVDRRLQYGKWVSLGGIVAALPPVGALLYYFVAAPYTTPSAVWFWASAISPVVLFLGLSFTAAGFGRWIELGDRLWSDATVAPQRLSLTGQSGRTSASAELLDLGTPMPAFEGPWRSNVRPNARRALYAVVLVGLLSVSLVAVGLVARDLGGFPTPGAAYRPAPIVLAKSGAVWAIPGDHYEWESFPVNRSATVSGTFNATGPLDSYVMDENAFAMLQFSGRVVSDQFGAHNVTAGAFNVKLPYNDRWYVVLLNPSPTLSVQATWSTDCLVAYSS